MFNNGSFNVPCSSLLVLHKSTRTTVSYRMEDVYRYCKLQHVLQYVSLIFFHFDLIENLLKRKLKKGKQILLTKAVIYVSRAERREDWEPTQGQRKVLRPNDLWLWTFEQLVRLFFSLPPFVLLVFLKLLFILTLQL